MSGRFLDNFIAALAQCTKKGASDPFPLPIPVFPQYKSAGVFWEVKCLGLNHIRLRNGLNQGSLCPHTCVVTVQLCLKRRHIFYFILFFFALVFKGRSKAPKQVRVHLGLETLSDMGSALQAIKRYLSSQKERNLRHTLLSVFLLASFNSSQLSLTVCSEFLSEASHSPRGRDLRH